MARIIVCVAMVAVLLVGCVSPPTESGRSPFAVSTYSGAMGVIKGGSDSASWKSPFTEVDVTPLRTEKGEYGIGVRSFRTNGHTDAGFDFDEKTEGGGLAMVDVAKDGKEMFRTSVYVLERTDEGDATSGFAEQRTTLLYYNLAYTSWRTRFPELFVWSEADVPVHEAGDVREDRMAIRVGGIADFLHTRGSLVTLGAGLEGVYTEEREARRRIASLFRIRLFQVITVEPWYSFNDGSDDTHGVSFFIRVWGRE